VTAVASAEGACDELLDARRAIEAALSTPDARAAAVVDAWLAYAALDARDVRALAHALGGREAER